MGLVVTPPQSGIDLRNDHLQLGWAARVELLGEQRHLAPRLVRRQPRHRPLDLVAAAAHALRPPLRPERRIARAKLQRGALRRRGLLHQRLLRRGAAAAEHARALGGPRDEAGER